MRPIQPITYRGQVVAVVIVDHAVIAEELAGSARRLVEAKCLYALRVNAGDLPGPYSDRDAQAYARAALDLIAELQGPPGPRPLTPHTKPRRGQCMSC
jgi:hypothetical protein